MMLRLASLIDHPVFAESNATRRGKLIGLFLGSVIILVVGIVLFIKNQKKTKNKNSRNNRKRR